MKALEYTGVLQAGHLRAGMLRRPPQVGSYFSKSHPTQFFSARGNCGLLLSLINALKILYTHEGTFV